MHKRMYKTILIALCMLILILDTKTVISGASEGLTLCFHVLIPSLLPFFLISVLLTSQLSGVTSTILRPIGTLLRIPNGTESLFLVGILGGYPVGAQVISQAVQSGFLPRREANRMIAFCNNAGPAFIFGVISAQFPNLYYSWVIWATIILSSIFSAILLPGGKRNRVTAQSKKHITVTEAMGASIKALSGVCGWVIIFRVIMKFLERWILWIFPIQIQIFINSILELANGSLALSQIESIGLRLIICTAGLSFGGICVLLQTAAVADELNLKLYLLGKCLQTIISVLLVLPSSLAMEYGLSFDLAAGSTASILLFLLILSYYRKKHENNSGNLILSGV